MSQRCPQDSALGTLMTCTGQTIPGEEVTTAGAGDFVSLKKKKKDFQLVDHVPSLRTAGVTSHAPWVLSSPEPSCSLRLCPEVREH